MSEIIFNGKSSCKDFDAILVYFKPQPPTPQVIKCTVPYMNGSYDFSSLYGEQTYSERKILCKLDLVSESRIPLYIKYNEVLNWLLTDEKQILEYTEEPGIYYMAKIESVPSWDIISTCGIFEFEFIAYPFKFGKNYEGADIWDEFNFEVDYLQNLNIHVNESKDIKIYNPSSKKIVPSVITDSEISVIKNNVTYKFNKGTTQDWRFSLEKGENKIKLQGNGNIEFKFRKEVF
ncbi:phage tail domain-containing protein [Clostridium septicum]|uniref:phage tail domain-containing protein n=1 Tax=Clostridium septicum TaxID=1504 RepID=UPI00082F3C86|nr:phage tail domain-containing protein [Clostridium septicum]